MADIVQQVRGPRLTHRKELAVDHHGTLEVERFSGCQNDCDLGSVDAYLRSMPPTAASSRLGATRKRCAPCRRTRHSLCSTSSAPSSLPPEDPLSIELVEITAETLSSVLRLSVTSPQEAFVASNAISIAQAHFCSSAWFRAIHAHGEPVGFVMLDKDPRLPTDWGLPQPTAYLWRLMIDARHQRRGHGRAAVSYVIDLLDEEGFGALATSFVPAPGDPARFYADLGFTDTGEVDEGEHVLVRRLSSPTAS